jgi:hypothetical protein
MGSALEVFEARGYAESSLEIAPIERLVMGIFALFTGLSVDKMIDPDEVDEALFGEMLGLLAKSAMTSKP